MIPPKKHSIDQQQNPDHNFSSCCIMHLKIQWQNKRIDPIGWPDINPLPPVIDSPNDIKFPILYQWLTVKPLSSNWYHFHHWWPSTSHHNNTVPGAPTLSSSGTAHTAISSCSLQLVCDNLFTHSFTYCIPITYYYVLPIPGSTWHHCTYQLTHHPNKTMLEGKMHFHKPSNSTHIWSTTHDQPNTVPKISCTVPTDSLGISAPTTQ